MKASFIVLLQLFFLLMLAACKKPYAPAITTSNAAYLVVEGVINSGNDTTVINLSRTVPLTDSKVNSPETGAKIFVESSKNDQYPLNETAVGTYQAINLNLPTDRTYRLHIITSKNEEYVSDYVQNMITPPVDSLYGIPDNAGVQFYINTHNTANPQAYYRWSYSEGWTYLMDASESSEWEFDNDQIVGRVTPIGLTCYKFGPTSSSIFIGASHLQKGGINGAQLNYVSASTGLMSGVFCLTVKQYALTGDAYTFWNLLRNNTERLGNIFDEQPSSSLTNIHAVNKPNVAVVGYVSVSTVTTKRVFVNGSKLPFPVVGNPPVLPISCPTGYISVAPSATFQARAIATFASGDTIIIDAITIPGTPIVLGYNYAPLNCLDCQTSGGTNVTPSYWPHL